MYRLGTQNQIRRIKPKRPLRCLTVITKLELGGAQQVALNTLQGLDTRQYQKFLIAGQGGWLDAEARQLAGVEVHLWQSFKHPVRVFSDIVTCWRLFWFMRTRQIDIVHTHSSKAGILGRLAAKLAGVPVVVHTVHGWPFHEYQSRWIRRVYAGLERLAAQWCTVLIAVSNATRQQGEQYGIGRPGQYQIVYPASDLSAFVPGTQAGRLAVRKEFGWANNVLLVGMVACLKPQKAPLDFIRAAKIVWEKIPHARFLLVGDGQERAAVEKEIARLGMENIAVLAGWREDVPRLMQAMDALALSSLWEGLPCVLAQAMASGLPVVATDVAGSKEAVQPEKTGLLVLPKDFPALGQALIRILQDKSLRKRMGSLARKAAKKFEMSAMLTAIDQIYQTAWQRCLSKELLKHQSN